jgi:hypothetical protein
MKQRMKITLILTVVLVIASSLSNAEIFTVELPEFTGL